MSLAVSAIWLLHPMQISTVMYVVQRMTVLSGTFTLLGLILYCKGRARLADTPWHGYAQMAIGVGLCSILATLAKQSGALLPVFALCLEITLLRELPGDRWKLWQRFGRIGLMLVPVALAAYIVRQWPVMLQHYVGRGYTLPERLLTEGRVLLDYLRLMAIPSTAELGIFGDGYPLSRGWLSPPATLAAAAFLAALVVAGLALHRRAAWISLAILWFFAGHLLESTVLPLEIYFEHRNYLPMLGPIVGLAWWLARLRPDSHRFTASIMAIFPALLALLTYSSSLVWGNQALAAEIWPRQHPQSQRVRQMSARYWADQGRLDLAEAQLTAAAIGHPERPHLYLQVAQMRCLQGLDVQATLSAANKGLSGALVDLSTLDTADNLRQLARDRRCASLSPQDVHAILDALSANPRYRDNSTQSAYLQFIRANTYADQGRIDEAVATLEQPASGPPSVQSRYWQTIWLLTAGRADEAEQHLDLVKQANDQRPTDTADWTGDVRKLGVAINEVRKLGGKRFSVSVDNGDIRVTPLPTADR
jgi:tetratricopeptide (TPR) repeat protein